MESVMHSRSRHKFQFICGAHLPALKRLTGGRRFIIIAVAKIQVHDFFPAAHSHVALKRSTHADGLDLKGKKRVANKSLLLETIAVVSASDNGAFHVVIGDAAHHDIPSTHPPHCRPESGNRIFSERRGWLFGLFSELICH